ncbi:MAG TPA: universal stress protein [Candidatus Lokiarchaeia archaeon]|nr:universal stress protein [Candidatus Lokiarchaeia archaeon]
MFKNILIPLDGSATSLSSAEYAMKFAQEQDASITLLYVINERNIQKMADLTGQEHDEIVGQFKEQGKKFFQATKKNAHKIGVTIEVEEIMLVGDPAEEIINFAQKTSFDLIIMATKDREHSSRFMLGHVTNRVIESGVAPVLAIPFITLAESPLS